MKLRLTLILLCLLGIGLFAKAQDKKKEQAKPTVENGPDAIRVIVKSNKQAHHLKPPPPPQIVGKEGLPPPRIEVMKFDPQKIKKDVEQPPPPPPPSKPGKTKAALPVRPDAPPAPPERTNLSC